MQPSTSSSANICKAILKVSPLPDAKKKRTEARTRRSEKSEVLTSLAHKLLTEEKEIKKRLKEQKKNLRNKLKKTRTLKPRDTNQETVCVVCLETNEEDWIQCSSCQKWAHEACADISECSEDYICDRCKLY